MDSDSSNEEFHNSDNELDDATHKKLMKNVLSLTHKQHVKNSTRTEPALQVSEFDLAKAGKNVHISDLANVLQHKGKQEKIAKHLKRAQQKISTLPKPLEKPQAERIHRAVAYKKTQGELAKWDPIVTAMRASVHTSFPLPTDSKLDQKADTLGADWGYKTDLQKELEQVEPKAEVFVMEEDEFPMTKKEMMEKRSEAARMRAHESYKIAKARRQNKIKSKKYHRVQKKEKLKQQMKEFELLQKTNPEAALEKLEEIERAHAEERMSLRHKSTGQWARSKLVRAKYDKETRQVLAQQLSIGRDLTQKLKKTDSDSEQEATEDTGHIKLNTDNPWLNDNLKVSKEVGEFVSGYRKYWEEKNGIKDAATKDEAGEANKIESTAGESAAGGFDDDDKSDDDDGNDISEFTKVLKEKTKNISSSAKRKAKATESGSPKTSAKKIKLKTKTKAKSRCIDSTDSEWTVTSAPAAPDALGEFDLQEEFNKIDRKLRKKVEEKVKLLTNGTGKPKSTKKGQTIKPKSGQSDLLALPKQNLRPVIDEELNERAYRGNKEDDPLLKAYGVLKGKSDENGAEDEAHTAPEAQRRNQPKADEIDPNKFINMKTTALNTAIPDLLEFEDNEEHEDQRGVISEAFQDDDVVDNFRKEKQEEIDGSVPKSVDLSLPGWGAWGGKGIAVSVRKRKRFLVKFPGKMKRKDSNKGDLFLNENVSSKLREHLVSEIPFPFKNVKDYEASIRAPIGSTFVPETAFRKLTKPAVTTKLGTVIEPMTEDILVKKKKK